MGIIINGDKVELKLTKEQLKELGKTLGVEVIIEKENPFDVKRDEFGFYVDAQGNVYMRGGWTDKQIKNLCPCKDKSLAEERAKQERLSRLLWKFTNENNLTPNNEEMYNENIKKWYIGYDIDEKTYFFDCYISNKKIPLNVPLFKKEKDCQRAINEVVIPFMNGEL